MLLSFLILQMPLDLTQSMQLRNFAPRFVPRDSARVRDNLQMVFREHSQIRLSCGLGGSSYRDGGRPHRSVTILSTTTPRRLWSRSGESYNLVRERKLLPKAQKRRKAARTETDAVVANLR